MKLLETCPFQCRFICQFTVSTPGFLGLLNEGFSKKLGFGGLGLGLGVAKVRLPAH